LHLVQDQIELSDEVLIEKYNPRVPQIDAACDDLDALVEGLLHDIAHRLGLPAVDDDACDPKVDRLTDLFTFLVGSLPALEDMKVEAERLCLAGDAALIGLEKVAAREIADKGDLDPALVEWRRRARKPVGLREAGSDEKARRHGEAESTKAVAYHHRLHPPFTNRAFTRCWLERARK
jgi:hypothetical protein